MRDDLKCKKYNFIDAFTVDSKTHYDMDKCVHYLNESEYSQLRSVSENKVRKCKAFLFSYGSILIEILT